jgi:hypothetical protein
MQRVVRKRSAIGRQAAGSACIFVSLMQMARPDAPSKSTSFESSTPGKAQLVKGKTHHAHRINRDDVHVADQSAPAGRTDPAGTPSQGWASLPHGLSSSPPCREGGEWPFGSSEREGRAPAKISVPPICLTRSAKESAVLLRHAAGRGQRASTVVPIPPRGRNSPRTTAHTGSQAFTTSSRTWLTMFSWKMPRLR